MQQLSNIELVNQLDIEGKLRQLINDGVFPCKIYQHRDIYYYVDAQVKSGVSKTEAVEMAESSFNCSIATVYRIVKSFSI